MDRSWPLGAHVAAMCSSMSATTINPQPASICKDLDPFDPNNWDAIFAERDGEIARIYLDDRMALCAIIDAIDYQWATQWRWCALRHKSAGTYARRAVGVNGNGMRLRTYSLYLHVEIHKRKNVIKPSAKHFLVDHRDGNPLNCRRSNLRWATVGMNIRNRGGAMPFDMVDG